MTRYYYDDPLAAAWMAKHFDMRFKSAKGSDMHFEGGSDFRITKDGGVYGGEKHYIHQESLNLLEPQVGDLIGRGIRVVNDKDAPRIFATTIGETKPSRVHEGKPIIQRNGIPFHHPKKED